MDGLKEPRGFMGSNICGFRLFIVCAIKENGPKTIFVSRKYFLVFYFRFLSISDSEYAQNFTYEVSL